MIDDYYDKKLYGQIIKGYTGTICSCMQMRNDLLLAIKNGEKITKDERYLCEYVLPRKIASAVKSLNALYDTQIEDLAKFGINTEVVI